MAIAFTITFTFQVISVTEVVTQLQTIDMFFL